MSANVSVRAAATDTERRRAFQFVERHVVGFSASRAMKTDTGPRRNVTALLPQASDGSLASGIIFTAHDDVGTMVGAISAHAPYEEAAEIRRSGNVGLARGFLRDRRTIAGLAVEDGWRRRGVATELLSQVKEIAQGEGAVWLVGFMDERNGEPDFYQANGFTITKRNQALPPLPPSAVNERHPTYVNGRWFYRPIR